MRLHPLGHSIVGFPLRDVADNRHRLFTQGGLDCRYLASRLQDHTLRILSHHDLDPTSWLFFCWSFSRDGQA